MGLTISPPRFFVPGQLTAISPYSGYSIGSLYPLGAPSNGAWTANLAHLIPFVLPEPRLLYKIGWFNGTGANAGNADAAVHDAAGNRLISTGSTAQAGGTSVWQMVDVADTWLPRGVLLYMSMAVDSGSGNYIRWNLGAVAAALGCRSKTSSFPLPNPLTGTVASTGYIPLMMLELRPL